MFACAVSGFCCQLRVLWGSSEMLSCQGNCSKLNQKRAEVQILCQPTEKKAKRQKISCLLISGITVIANWQRISHILKAFLPCTEAREGCAQNPFICVQDWFDPGFYCSDSFTNTETGGAWGSSLKFLSLSHPGFISVFILNGFPSILVSCSRPL